MNNYNALLKVEKESKRCLIVSIVESISLIALIVTFWVELISFINDAQKPSEEVLVTQFFLNIGVVTIVFIVIHLIIGILGLIFNIFLIIAISKMNDIPEKTTLLVMSIISIFGLMFISSIVCFVISKNSKEKYKDKEEKKSDSSIRNNELPQIDSQIV